MQTGVSENPKKGRAAVSMVMGRTKHKTTMASKTGGGGGQTYDRGQEQNAIRNTLLNLAFLF